MEILEPGRDTGSVGPSTNRRFLWLSAWFVLVSTVPALAQSDGDIRAAMVKVFAVKSEYSYTTPWLKRDASMSTGSGFLIGRNQILTNAHVVADSTFLEVRFHGEATKYPARVLFVSHEADLALLTVEETRAPARCAPLRLGQVPNPRDKIVVYGFPEGGDTLSSTEGVVSRVEHCKYAQSGLKLLAIQLDAAINAGNSGGPAVAGDRVVGVAMQTLNDADNIGYVIPVPVIRQFLEDIKDGKLDGIPTLGLLTQNIENDALRAAYGLTGDRRGVLVNRVVVGMPGEDVVLPGDVLMAIDGQAVAGDHTVALTRDQRTDAAYFVQCHQIGETVEIQLLRQGVRRTEVIALDRPAEDLFIVPHLRYDTEPSYFVYGGIVFGTLTANYLDAWPNGNYGVDFSYLRWLREEPADTEDEDVVLLIKVLASEVNRGYHDLTDLRITKVNGQKIHTLRDLMRIVEAEKELPYVRFEDARGQQIVLDRKAADASNESILATYGVPKDRSADLCGRH